MNKRLAKRHKRQVSRAKERVRLSEPDLRTPEQIAAAREASRANRGGSSPASVRNSVPSFRNNQGPNTGSAAKTDG
jgi:hypothetical protein